MGNFNASALSAIRLKMGTYGGAAYNLVYDFNGDKTVNNSDINVIRLNLGAYSDIYKETRDWIKP